MKPINWQRLHGSITLLAAKSNGRASHTRTEPFLFGVVNGFCLRSILQNVFVFICYFAAKS